MNDMTDNSMADRSARVRTLTNVELGLDAVLTIDSFGSAGIAIGGCRVRDYDTPEAALADSKKLAKNMSLKYGVVRLGYGGLKLVISKIDTRKRHEAFRQVGRWIDEYDGRCYIATDFGTSIEDMIDVNTQTEYVLDTPKNLAKIGSFTALLTRGVMRSLDAAADFRYSMTLDGMSAYVQGFGNSGLQIARALVERGCDVSGYDVDGAKNAKAEGLGVNIRESFLDQRYDLFVPCALDNVINSSNSSLIRAGIIGGSANNPVDPGQEQTLFKRGIVSIPDYVISSGAIILDDLIIQKKSFDEQIIRERIERIHDFTHELLSLSYEKNIPPYKAGLMLLGL